MATSTAVLSGIWRPTIGDSSENIGTSIEDELVSALRDSASRTLKARRMSWSELLSSLRQYEMPLIERIATYLLATHDEPPIPAVLHGLNDEAQIAAFLPEYKALLVKSLGSLSRENAEGLLSKIAAGPSVLPEGADNNRYRRVWVYRRLFVLRGQLKSPFKEQLEALEAEFEGQDPNPPRSGTWIGPTSPLSEDELAARDPTEVVDYLRTWKPPAGIFVDSPHGLGRRLAIAVERRAMEYSLVATLFTDLHATYVRELISGIRSAVEGGAQIAWQPVLDLIRNTTAKDRADPGSFGEAEAHIDRMDFDPDWRWARKQMASLIEAGLTDADQRIPGSLAEPVLEVLRELASDPEPDAAYEEKYGGENSDWDTLALNTVRPAAISGTFRYVAWVQKQLHDEAAPYKARALALLDDHLDPEADPSLAVRSVYGRNLPLLFSDAEDWFELTAPRVWPVETEHLPYFWAAWTPFIAFWRPHTPLFRRLEKQYQHALRIAGEEPDWRWLANPTERLGQHLIAFYLGREIEYDPWLSEYFSRVNEEVAGSVLSDLGRVIDSALTDNTDRAMRLWDERVAQIRNSNGSRPQELGAFAWWFVEKSLPLDWALDRLIQVLNGGAEIEYPDEVIERLVEASAHPPVKAVEALGLIVRAVNYPWRLGAITQGARAILATALGADDELAQAGARRVIGELAMLHGRREFRNLLDQA